MRNPFARLAKRDTAQPSLRERAASLKASASRVIGRKPMDIAPAVLATPAAAADPIFAAITETQRLAAGRTVAAHLPQPAGTFDPLPEQEAAADAFYAHVDSVLLKTVPTTAAGCVALARYAGEFPQDEGFALDEDASNEQHVRILGMIARSPLLDTTAVGSASGTALDPVFAAIQNAEAARATLNAWCDRLETEGWDALGGADVAQTTEERLGVAHSDAVGSVLGTTPSTEAGRYALVHFIEDWVGDHGNLDGSPQDGSETVFADVYPALLRALRAPLGVGTAAFPDPRTIAARLDLASADLRALSALHGAVQVLDDVCDAVGCQPRCTTGNPIHPIRGSLSGEFVGWVGEVCSFVLDATTREARSRRPTDVWNRTMRLHIIARSTIENDDRAEALALARDIEANAWS